MNHNNTQEINIKNEQEQNVMIDCNIVASAKMLEEALEAMFDCHDGPQSSNYGMNGSEPVLSNESNKAYSYVTFGCMTNGDDAREAEKSLASYLHNQFQKLPKTTLVWRVKPQYETRVDIKFGDKYVPSDDASESIPDGVEYDIITGCYRHVLQKTVMHGLRMRAGFPELDGSPLLQFGSKEGEIPREIARA